jgi:hypothetical protein
VLQVVLTEHERDSVEAIDVRGGVEMIRERERGAKRADAVAYHAGERRATVAGEGVRKLAEESLGQRVGR